MAKEKPAGELIESRNEGDASREPTARVTIRLPLSALQFIDTLRGITKNEKGNLIMPDGAPSRSEVVRNVIITHSVMKGTESYVQIKGADGSIEYVKLSDVLNVLIANTKSTVKVGRPKKTDEKSKKTIPDAPASKEPAPPRSE